MIIDKVFVQHFANTLEIETLIRASFEGLAVAANLGPHSRVSIKPNFTYPWYRPGVTTSPVVLEAIVSVLRDYTANIRIVESDGGSHAWSADQAFRGHDVPAICRKYGIVSVGLTQQRRTVAQTVVDGREIQIELPALLVEETDLLITAPVPKVHAMTLVSLGFKNQWGCIPDIKRLNHHPDFARKVIAVNKILKTQLAVFDGTYFLNRSGPMNGEPVRKNLLIVGPVGLATAACCELMQVNPLEVPHLSIAVREGLMPSGLDASQCNVALGPLRSKFHLQRRALDWLSLAIFHSRLATRLCYDSRFALPLHSMAYLLKGKPKDFTPVWGRDGS